MNVREGIAVIACRDDSSSAWWGQFFESIFGKELGLDDDVFICIRSARVDGRYLTLGFDGDLRTGFEQMYRWCEQNTDEAALIYVGPENSEGGIYAENILRYLQQEDSEPCELSAPCAMEIAAAKLLSECRTAWTDLNDGIISRILCAASLPGGEVDQIALEYVSMWLKASREEGVTEEQIASVWAKAMHKYICEHCGLQAGVVFRFVMLLASASFEMQSTVLPVAES